MTAVQTNSRATVPTKAHLEPAPRPRALLLLGAKGGDNAQIRLLARHIGAETTEIQLRFNWLHVLPNWILPTRTLNLPRAARTALLASEKSDLIIASGKRSYRAARRIKAQLAPHAAWIHIGRPWGNMNVIDLILTTPQYRLPTVSNVIMLPYPLCLESLHGRDEATPGGGGVVVLVGGDSTTHFVAPEDATALIAAARALAESAGLAITIVTSRRTPKSVTAALNARATADIRILPWGGQRADESGPGYAETVARANLFVVTNDSASMLADAYETGRPVYVFPTRERLLVRIRQSLERLAAQLVPAGLATRLARMREAAVMHGLTTPPRSMAALVEGLADATPAATLTTPGALRCVQRGELPSSRFVAARAVRRLLERRKATLSARA